jgi:MFS family permease
MRAVLRNGPFLRLWIAQLLSQTANNMVNFALLIRVQNIIEIHHVRQANTATSLVILAFSLPAILFGPVAGVIADRFNKRLVMFATNVLRAVAMVLFLAIRPGWHVESILAATYFVTFIFGIAGQFFAPAQGAMVPVLVDRANLVSANALFNLTFTGSQLLGFAVVGPIFVKLFGVDAVFGLTLVVFVACAGLVMTLPDAPPSARLEAVSQHPMRRLWRDVKEGLRFILQDPVLIRAIANLTIAATTFLMIAALGPEFITSVIGLPKEDVVYVVLPAGLGVLAGVLLVNQALRLVSRGVLIDSALTLAGISLLGIALVDPLFNLFWIHGNAPNSLVIGFVGALAAILGMCNAFILIPSQTVLQERSHEHIRARVYATFYTISNTFSFIPIFFAAAMADLFGVAEILALVAVIVASYGAASLLHRKAAEEARWQAKRTRHREGPETLIYTRGRR